MNTEAPEEGSEAENVSNEVILDRPIHDTGSAWYAIFSFLLPILGIIAAYVFRRRNYIRNFKACRKGVLSFLACLGVLIGVLVLLALITIIF